jgi:hypothetical protein
MITALQNQSLFDLAIQYAGSSEAAFALAVANNLSVTDDLQPGQQLREAGVINKSIADYYAGRQLKPATAVVPERELRLRYFDTEFPLEFN